MPIDYLSFEIEVLQQDPETYQIRAEVNGATRAEHIPADLPLLIPEEIQQAQSWLERGFIDREFAQDFGKRLFLTLFPGEIGKLFGEAIQRAGKNGGVRVILKFPMPPALMELPWELMYAEDFGIGYLARSSQSPLVRHYADLPLHFLPPDEGPLRVLLVIASPKDQPPVSGHQEVEAITRVLERPWLGLVDRLRRALTGLLYQRSFRRFFKRLRQHALVEIEVLDRATLSKLQARLLAARSSGQEFHVIHFIGHAQSGIEGSQVLLEDNNRSSNPISAEEFAELVAEPSVNLVVLNACETANGFEHISSVSLEVLRRRVPAVIGMQTPIIDRTALNFAQEFYAAWAAGEPVEAALAYARRLIGKENRAAASDWSIPVLYMSSMEGLSLRLKEPTLRVPPFLRTLRWGVAAFISILGAIALLLQVPDIAQTVRTEMPVIRCIYPYPMPPQPSFNIAVAEFGYVEGSGSPRANRDGSTISDYLARRLESYIKESNIKPEPIVRPLGRGCIIPGKGDQRAQNAANLAERIGAQIVIYGTIENEDGEISYKPEFYVDPTHLTQALELTGQYNLGEPLPLPTGFKMDELNMDSTPGLSARNQAMVLIIVGLAHYSMDSFDRAREVFQSADTIPGWTQNAGRDVLYLLKGNTAARLMSRDVLTLSNEDYHALMDESRINYETALGINPHYLRAKIGLGDLLINQALGDPQTSPADFDLSALDKAAEELDEILIQANALANSSNPDDLVEQKNLVFTNIVTKAHFKLGRIHLLRAQALLAQLEMNSGNTETDQVETELRLAEAEYDLVIDDYDQGDQLVEDLASHALAAKGLISMLRGDFAQAIPRFQRAIELASPFYKGQFSAALGDSYFYNGQTELAENAYEDAKSYAQLSGDNDLVIKISEILEKLQE